MQQNTWLLAKFAFKQKKPNVERSSFDFQQSSSQEQFRSDTAEHYSTSKNQHQHESISQL